MCQLVKTNEDYEVISCIPFVDQAAAYREMESEYRATCRQYNDVLCMCPDMSVINHNSANIDTGDEMIHWEIN